MNLIFSIAVFVKAPQSSAPRPEEYITMRATPHTDDLALRFWAEPFDRSIVLNYQLDVYWNIWDHNGPYKDLVWFHCLLNYP